MRRRRQRSRPHLPPVYHDVPCAECGHLGREHGAELPSVCNRALTDGACQCIIFSPPAVH